MVASMTGHSSSSIGVAPEAAAVLAAADDDDDGTKASTMRGAVDLGHPLSFIPRIKTSEGEAIISG